MSARRAFGWREDRGDPHALPVGVKLSTLKRKTSPSVMSLRGQRLFQGPAGACLAFTIVRSMYISLRGQGWSDAPMGSPKNVYYIGRAQEYAGFDPEEAPPLVDHGMYKSKALLAVRKMGWCRWNDDPYGSVLEKHDARTAERVYDLVPGTNERLINHKPPLSSHRASIDQRGLQWFTIPPSNRSQVIGECLKSDPPLPVGVAMNVGRRFLEVRDSEPIGFEHLQEPVGGHMMSAVERLPDGNIVVDNWWEDWGFDDGFGVLSEGLVNSNEVRDVFALLPVRPMV